MYYVYITMKNTKSVLGKIYQDAGMKAEIILGDNLKKLNYVIEYPKAKK